MTDPIHPRQELLAAHADGAAPDAERPGLETHLAACADCRRAVTEYGAVSKLVKDLPRAELPTGFMARLERRRLGEESPAARPRMGLSPLRLAAFAATGLLVGLIFFREVRYGMAPRMLGLSDSGIESGGLSVSQDDARGAEMDAGAALQSAGGVEQARREMALRGSWSGGEGDAPSRPGAAGAAGPLKFSQLSRARIAKNGAPLEAKPSASNEELHAFLEQEKSRMGIQEIVPPSAPAAPADGIPDRPLSKDEAMDVMRRMTSQLTSINRQAADRRNPSVSLGQGSTPRIIGSKEGSLPMADDAPKAKKDAKLAAASAGSLAMVRGADIRVDEPATFEPSALPFRRPEPEMFVKKGKVAEESQAAPASPAPAGPPRALNPRGSWSATVGGVGKAGGAVFTNAADWADLWKRVGRADPLPAVDFDAEMAVAVFGERSETAQSSVLLLSFNEEEGALVVRYAVKAEAGAGPSAPYSVAVLPKSALPVTFRAVQ